jgi:hypothetical protein
VSNYYTKQELSDWLETAHDHELILERDVLVQKKDIFYKALNEIQEKHRALIADCIDDCSYKIEMIDQKIEENDQTNWETVEV